MGYIHIEKTEDGKVKAIAKFSEKEYNAEFEDMTMAAIWAEEIVERESKDDG